MASVSDFLDRFYLEIDDQKHQEVPLPLAIAWYSAGNLEYLDETEMLQDVWEPSVTTSVVLPTNFLREIVVKTSGGTKPLKEVDYHNAIFEPTFTTPTTDVPGFYSKFGTSFYLWPVQSSAVTLTAPYIKKPTDVTISNYTTAEMDIPTEFRSHLLSFMLAQFFSKKEEKEKEIKWKLEFERFKSLDRAEFNSRRYAPQEVKVEEFYQNM